MFSSFLINLIVFVLSLVLLIVIHEFGHYITSKWFNVYVNEFSIGFGPALYQRKKENGETQFSIRAIPLGGYCSIVGESLPDISAEEYDKLSTSDKELFDLYRTVPENRRLDGIPKYKRAVIMVAGVSLNFVLGLVLLLFANALTPIPNFSEVVSESFKDFGDYSVAIFEALGNLFTKEGIEGVGGMIAIFGVQQEAMTLGLGYVIRLWALISINLGIMNLLPFPGLDGWHLLVIIIEGVTRRELPKKFKSIMSTIGMLLLFGLMILITFKDIFSLASSFMLLK